MLVFPSSKTEKACEGLLRVRARVYRLELLGPRSRCVLYTQLTCLLNM